LFPDESYGRAATDAELNLHRLECFNNQLAKIGTFRSQLSLTEKVYITELVSNAHLSEF
jgi:hypothetical protein